MLVNQDKNLIPKDLRVIKYREDLPSTIVYRPIQPDGQPVEEDITLEEAVILGPTYHGWGIRVKTKEGNTIAILREHLVRIDQPGIAGGHGKHYYFGEKEPVQTMGRAGDVYVTASGEVLEKWVPVITIGGGESGTGSDTGTE
ncbi:MAG: hypothetical protein NC548_29615 [Lachnospiraceae bacterium]|nr:hypothetical protein [Lachnospiraceae bacterium]